MDASLVVVGESVLETGARMRSNSDFGMRHFPEGSLNAVIFPDLHQLSTDMRLAPTQFATSAVVRSSMSTSFT